MTAAGRSEAALALSWELPAPRGRWRAALRLVRQNPVGTVALAVLLLLCLAALFAPLIAPYSPTAQPGGRLEAPSSQYWFGTDRIGRDVFSRLLYGGRISLLVGFVAVGTGTLIGSAIGMVSGFLSGWVDLTVQRLMDIVMSIPALLLAMVIVASFGRGVANALIAIAIVLIPTAARVMRGVVLQIQARAYVEAAQACGASSARVLLRHVVPNAIDEVLILASIALAAAVIIEAALSFLGLGAQPPTPSWGQMLAEGRQNYLRAPHMVWAPSLAICIAVLSVTLVGDTLRDIIDPRTRGAKAARF
ncbi:MAG TPA: ABC transporter permease [Dehalococcoidia bacterium]|jgi:peptide/nickel transport system permease protein